MFSTLVDVAIDKDGQRMEMDVRELHTGDKIYDLGPKTVVITQRSLQMLEPFSSVYLQDFVRRRILSSELEDCLMQLQILWQQF